MVSFSLLDDVKEFSLVWVIFIFPLCEIYLVVHWGGLFPQHRINGILTQLGVVNHSGKGLPGPGTPLGKY